MDSSWVVSFVILSLSLLNANGVLSCSPNGYEVLTLKEGQLSSPGYPKYYQKPVQCIWLITVDSGYVVSLEFEEFDVGHDAGCSDRDSRTTFVEVRDGISKGNKTLGSFCGSSKPREVTSAGNQMWIIYETNGYRSTRFNARYSATQDSSVVTISLLALVAIFGPILCICVTIAIIKRHQQNMDDETVKNLSRDIEQERNHDRACALRQIPSLLLLASVNSLDEGNERHSSNRQGTESLPWQLSNCHLDIKNVQLHRPHKAEYHDHGTSRPTMVKHNVTTTGMGGVTEEGNTRHYRILPQTDLVDRRESDSTCHSDLTSAKVIFVQESSFSRSSFSSCSYENKSFNQ